MRLIKANKCWRKIKWNEVQDVGRKKARWDGNGSV